MNIAVCPECGMVGPVDFVDCKYFGMKGNLNTIFQAICSYCGHRAEILGTTKELAVDGFEFEKELLTQKKVDG